jgi:hypothetical protein
VHLGTGREVGNCLLRVLAAGQLGLDELRQQRDARTAA